MKDFERAQRLEAIVLDRKKITNVLSKIEFGDCWNWTGWLDKNGYAYVSYKNRQINAHRFFYAWCCGEVPKGKVVRHTCDNRKCVNPEHLILGTMLDNSQDMIQAGRSMCGEKNAASVLTDEKVLEAARLYESGWSLARLCEKYNVHGSTMLYAISGKTWKHLDLKIDYPSLSKEKRTRKMKAPSEATKIMWGLWKSGKGWREIGGMYGISDNAAKKRILRYEKSQN